MFQNRRSQQNRENSLCDANQIYRLFVKSQDCLKQEDENETKNTERSTKLSDKKCTERKLQQADNRKQTDLNTRGREAGLDTGETNQGGADRRCGGKRKATNSPSIKGERWINE